MKEPARQGRGGLGVTPDRGLVKQQAQGQALGCHPTLPAGGTKGQRPPLQELPSPTEVQLPHLSVPPAFVGTFKGHCS